MTFNSPIEDPYMLYLNVKLAPAEMVMAFDFSTASSPGCLGFEVSMNR